MAVTLWSCYHEALPGGVAIVIPSGQSPFLLRILGFSEEVRVQGEGVGA